MLVVYTIESEAEEIDVNLLQMDNPIFKYLSFHHSMAEQRIATMHTNEMSM